MEHPAIIERPGRDCRYLHLETDRGVSFELRGPSCWIVDVCRTLTAIADLPETEEPRP